MSNKSRLQTNNTNLQGLINKANALPDAGSGSSEDLDSVITELETKVATLNTTLDGKAAGGGGGASIETCTVTITADRAIMAYGVTKYVDGVLVCEADRGYGEQEFTFVDVVKGSCLSVTFMGFDLSTIVVTNCTAECFFAADIEGFVIALFRVND